MSTENSKSVSDGVEVPYDSNRLLLEGVPETCTDEMIRLYLTLLLNADLNEDFELVEVRRNRHRVMAKFNIKLDYERVNERQQKLSELGGAQVTMHRVRLPDTLRVYELANNCTKEVLNLYFSNNKVSNGGDIKSIKMFSYEQKALVQFQNYKQIQDVLSKQHVICDTVVKLDKYYGAIEDEYFLEEEEFENQINEQVQASILAANANASSSSLYDSVKLDATSIDLARKRKSIWTMTSLKSFNSPTPSIEKTKLVVSNIQENVNIQQIDFLIQLITNRTEINEINWSLEHKGKLLIDFRKEIDINRILYEFNQNGYNNLNGKPIQLETLTQTRTLVVLVKENKTRKRRSAKDKLQSGNEEDDYDPESIPATKDLLELYFVNKSRSGGGEIELIERKSSRHWLLLMRDQRAVKDILSRKHTVDEKAIRVFPYYENFGLPYLFKPIFDESGENYISSSASGLVFKLKIKDDRLRYFCKVKNLHKKLNEILSESNAVSRYNKQESNILYVNYLDKVKTRVPYMERMWRLKVKESIEYFLNIYKFEKLTLSFNQWATICKTKQINESLLSRNQGEEEFDDTSMVDASSVLLSDDKIKYVGNNCAIISVTETESNVEMRIVGPNSEVDKFIVKIKDIICQAYFTFELEEKIIKFKTYLFECESLLAKWLKPSEESLADSDTELTLPSGSKRSTSGDEVSIEYKSFKLNNSRRKTIDEFITKLERDHLDMELSYGKLFQELGYTFLNGASGGDQLQEPQSDEEENEEDVDYRNFNDKTSSALDDTIVSGKNDVTESQMDKIKNTLDDMRVRINEMRKKFRQHLIKAKRAAFNKSQSKQTAASMSSRGEDDQDFEIDDDDDVTTLGEATEEEDDPDLYKISVFVKEKGTIITFRVHTKCKVKELKQILVSRANEDENNDEQEIYTLDNMVLSFNNLELSNNSLSLVEYGIGDKSTITLKRK